MREIRGDAWKYHADGHWLGITTNGVVNRRGELVMGRGIALQAKIKFPRLAKELGDMVETAGSQVYFLDDYRLFTFPVKYRWNEKADLGLIEKSARQLMNLIGRSSMNVVLPKPGCGNGQLEWDVVKPVLERVVDDSVWVIDW